MTASFLIFLEDLSKMDQIGSNWISHQSKNITIKSCHIYRKDKSVKRGECEEDSEWRDRFGGVDWIFLAFEFES